MIRKERQLPYVVDCPKQSRCGVDWDEGDELDEEYSERERLQNFWCVRCREWKICAVERK